VKRSGLIVARAACKQKETVLSPEVFSGSPGPAGAAGTKGDKGDSAGFSVIDSTGRKIGVADAYSYMPILLPSVGILSFEVGPDGFEPYSYQPYLYHEGSNCSGTAFVGHSVDDGFVQYVRVFNGIAYYAGNPVSKHAFNSYEYPAETCATGLTPRGFCCENYSSPYEVDAGPVQTLSTATIGTPPFTLVK
jgi:hypothetical protein